MITLTCLVAFIIGMTMFQVRPPFINPTESESKYHKIALWLIGTSGTVLVILSALALYTVKF